MKKDAIDQILDQWSEERPDLNTASLGVVIRVMTLYRSFSRQATRALEGVDLELWEYDVLSALRRQGEPQRGDDESYRPPGNAWSGETQAGP
jgi:hypothetical protein